MKKYVDLKDYHFLNNIIHDDISIVCSDIEVLKNKLNNFTVAADTNVNILIINERIGYDMEKKLTINVLRNAVFNLDLININSSNNSFDLKVLLKGKESKAEINITDIVLNSQKTNYNIDVINIEAETKANINFKAISSNSSDISAKITGIIEKEAINAENFQVSKAITLKDNSSVEIDPLLLIDNSEVKAGHSASISKISDSELYYLMSRGISRADGEKLIINAFVKSQIDLIKIEEYQEVIENKILSQLEK